MQVLDNSQTDLLGICRNSLGHLAALALGPRPLDASSSPLVPGADMDSEDDSEGAPLGAFPTTSHASNPPPGAQHVYLGRAPAKEVPSATGAQVSFATSGLSPSRDRSPVSPMHAHAHGLHSCGHPSCPSFTDAEQGEHWTRTVQGSWIRSGSGVLNWTGRARARSLSS